MLVHLTGKSSLLSPASTSPCTYACVQGNHTAIWQHLQPRQRICKGGVPGVSTEWTCAVHASSIRVAPAQQVLYHQEEWNQVHPAALHGRARFSAGTLLLVMDFRGKCTKTDTRIHEKPGPSVIGSSMSMIHPIRAFVFTDRSLESEKEDGGAPSKKHYCEENACINSRVHTLHMQVLQGNEEAHVQLNRYLLACAVLKNSGKQKRSRKKNGKALEAHIVWTCAEDCKNGCKDIAMTKENYKQQFRAWKPPSFCKAGNQLKLPILECLVTPLECTVQYNLLPDLGRYFRGILQRQYYTEQAKKQWIKCMQPMQMPSSATTAAGGNRASHHPQSSRQQALSRRFCKVLVVCVFICVHVVCMQPDHEDAAQEWDYMHGPCASMLLDSIPCMKRVKRSTPLQRGESSSTSAVARTEIMACINVMYGTLLKLYPLGAKTPTFNAKV